MGAFKNLVGLRFERLVVKADSGRRDKHGDIFWECVCDCGETREIRGASLRRGLTVSCGCKNREVAAETLRKYPNFESVKYPKEYAAWIHLRERCSPNSKNRKNYYDRGISVCKDWEESFLIFLQDVGKAPSDGRTWSVGRIDNNKGYCRENTRWETEDLQARNHTRQRNNTSGVTGVTHIQHRGKYKNEYWAAFWTNLDGKECRKSYNVATFGYDEAFRLACEKRKEELQRLQDEGAGYAETHGKEK